MMKKITQKKSNKKQKRRIIKVICLILAVLITSGGMYLGFGIFKQVEGFSKELMEKNGSLWHVEVFKKMSATTIFHKS